MRWIGFSGFKALWSALPEGLRAWIKGLLWSGGAAAGTLVVGTVSSLDPVQIWMFAVIAATTAAIGYAVWHSLHRPTTATSGRESDTIPPTTESSPTLQEPLASNTADYEEAKREARRILSMPPLKIELELKRNEGGTPGMYLRARNNDADTVPDAVVTVIDIRRWEESLRRFVTTEEIYGQENKFTEIQIGKATLHPARATQIAFLRGEGRKVVVQKQPGLGAESHRNFYPIQTPGIWKIACRVHSPDGRSIDGEVCFSWDGSDPSCTPCDCPPYPLGDCPPDPRIRSLASDDANMRISVKKR